MKTRDIILVVDDSQINRSILCRMLHKENYETLEAENGQIALNILSNEKQIISLVLLDISMPVMNGYELLNRMNETGLLTNTPVIVTTAASEEEAEIKCLELGASDFIKKPYNQNLVIHRVQSMLRLFNNAALINQLETDRLTGVYGKDAFYRHAEEILESNPKKEYIIVFTNIDDFKMVNARYGTMAGDELLKFFAKRFQEAAKDNGICGRIGADNFTILIDREEIKNEDALLRTVDDTFMDGSPIKGIELKAGVYIVTDRTISIADMCDRAKMAAVSISHQYDRVYAIYDEEMRKRAMREHTITAEMTNALANHEFVMYLQPKHSTDTGAIAGAEALVRWDSPTLGFVSPGDFIPLFERNGFVSKVDTFMWEEVCKTLRKWIDTGIQPIPISVNASRADFIDPDLTEHICALVDSYHLSHDLIHFEVTESAYTDHPQQMISAVSSLRNMGFLIEMDDFGAGYSSLNMLSELPIDIMKLDMRFMKTDNDKVKGGKQNILSFVVSLSKWLQFPTVAEGVETEDEFYMLKTMGCDYIQGYYFAKPMPVTEFESYMQEHPQVPLHNRIDTSEYMNLLTNTGSDKDKPLVLIVEDVESNREIMKELLSTDYRVAAVENGKLACEYLNAHRSEVSCMLLDLLMPVMDGFQVLQTMQLNGMVKEIPVIITTETGSNSELRALHLGADSFVSKPYNPEILLHHVKKAVEQKKFWEVKKSFDSETNVLLHRAYRDELTDLLNRYGLNQAFSSIPMNEEFTAVMLDVDDLKSINDTKGHTAGDKLLHDVASCLDKYTRDDDIVSRIGGDEFFIVFRHMKDEDIALRKMNTILTAIHSIMIDGTDFQPSCTAGLIITYKEKDSLKNITDKTDQAMMRTKKETKGTCSMYDPEKDSGEGDLHESDKTS